MEYTVVDTAGLGLTYYPCAPIVWAERSTLFASDSAVVERTRVGLRKRADVSNRLVREFGPQRTAAIYVHFQWMSGGCPGGFIIGPKYGEQPRLVRHMLHALREQGLLRKARVKGDCDPYVRNGGRGVGLTVRVLRSDESKVPNRFVWEVANLLHDEDFAQITGGPFDQWVEKQVNSAVAASLAWAAVVRHP